MFLIRKNKKSPEDQKGMQNPKILDVNLIKDEVKVAFDWNKNLLILLLVLILAGLFIAEIYFGLDWWEKQEIEKSQILNEQVLDIGRELNQLKGQNGEVLVFREKSALAGQLMSSHVYWSNFFSWLEKNTLSSVAYKAFSGNLDGKYSLAATAGDFAEVSWQAKAFLKDPLVKNVDISSASFSGDQKEIGQLKGTRVNFNLSLEISPDIFKK